MEAFHQFGELIERLVASRDRWVCSLTWADHRATDRFRSVPIDWTRGARHPRILEFVENIYGLVCELPPVARLRRSPALNHLNVLVCNLIHVEAQYPKFWIRIPRSPNSFRRIARYHPFGCSHRYTVAIIDALRSAALIEYQPGFYDRGSQRGRQSIIRLAPPFFSRFGQSLQDLRSFVRATCNQELIQLRDAGKRIIDYPETDLTRTMRRSLQEHNAFITKHDVSLDIRSYRAKALFGARPVDLSANQYHRVFNNGSFDQGGRFYGPWWQNLKSDLRPFIRIDGQSTVGLDYTAMHIHLLYGKEGITYQDIHGLEDDPYTLSSDDPLTRKAMKTILLVALNCTDKARAIQAIRRELQEQGLPLNGRDLTVLVECFARKHARISQYLFSGAGLSLQRTESDISMKVMTDMTLADIPILNVHDCFIAPIRHEAFLTEIMTQAFLDLGMSSTPKIKKEF